MLHLLCSWLKPKQVSLDKSHMTGAFSFLVSGIFYVSVPCCWRRFTHTSLSHFHAREICVWTSLIQANTHSHSQTHTHTDIHRSAHTMVRAFLSDQRGCASPLLSLCDGRSATNSLSFLLSVSRPCPSITLGPFIAPLIQWLLLSPLPLSHSVPLCLQHTDIP